ncbi:MAG: hypothetical protein IJX50_00210 [Clostridia bacterium]|nr:hypothetical protein [Clostridia bacterium]
MNETRVTQERINHLLETAERESTTAFGKCFVLSVRLENGFVLTESSACVDPKNYDAVIGRELCLKKIENKLWELEGYALQKKLYEGGASHENSKDS